MYKPLISIVVPIYNVEQWLSRCIESILDQTYKNLEIILSDDGSTDGCPGICDKYAQKDRRIVVIHKINGGLSDARNAAIDKAKGEYITCIDSDDFVSPDYVDTLFNLCDKYHCKMSVADWYIFPMGTNPVISKRKEKEIFFTRDKALEDMFNQVHFDNSACVKMYHRSLFEEIRYPKGQLYEDLQTTFKLMLKCKEGIAFSNKQIYYYMFRPGSIEGTVFSEKKMASAIEVFKVMQSYEEELGMIKTAVKTKMSAFCFHLLMKMPEGYNGSDILYDYIKKVRWNVITNTHGRMKNRLACFATFFGFNFTKRLFSLIDRRK